MLAKQVVSVCVSPWPALPEGRRWLYALEAALRSYIFMMCVFVCVCVCVHAYIDAALRILYVYILHIVCIYMYINL
jgi:hypothetical protein